MKRILLLLSVFAFVACVDDKLQIEEKQGGVVAFTAGFSDDSSVATRVFLENYHTDHLYVLWEKGDDVSVFDGENTGRFVSDRTGLSTSLMLESGATFNENANSYYALYPYSANAEFLQDGFVNTTLPAVQYARKEAFSSHLAVASATQTDKNFIFRNVTAIFKVNITMAGVKSLVFESKNGEVVAGDIKISIDNASYEILGAESTSVTVLPYGGESATFSPGVYYFTILPQTFATGFTITVNRSDSNIPIVRDVAGLNVEVPRSSLSVGKTIGTEGSGTLDSPYLIKNVYDFEGLATTMADDGIECDETTYIRIVADIDLSSVDSWTPINNVRHTDYIARLDVSGEKLGGDGCYSLRFFGPDVCAHGQKVNASGKIVSDASQSQPSIFGIIRGSVRHLNIEGANLVSDLNTVGILAGWIGYEGLNDETSVENVTVSGSVTGNKVVGGFAGTITNATVTNCSSNVTVVASGDHSSGFIARYYKNVTLNNCHSEGSVSGYLGVGGLLGYQSSDDGTTSDKGTRVESCSSRCVVTGNYQVGGLVGYVQGKVDIVSSWVNANVFGVGMRRNASFFSGKQVGGILGVAASGPGITVSQCYYKGDISADGSFIGGIVGYCKVPATISDCHAHTTIANSGKFHDTNPDTYYDMIGVGGIMGGFSSYDSELTIERCFVDEGTISSKANGTLAEADVPLEWKAWTEAVAKTNRTQYYLGGGVGGILGYSAATSTNVVRNVSWITSIVCERTNPYDASCAPIVGCLYKDNDCADVQYNRYYNGSMTFSDLLEGQYEPREISVSGDLRNNEINAVDNGKAVNQYCLYCRPAANTPSSAASTNTFGWSADVWNMDSDKPYLTVIQANGGYNQ